MHSDCLAIYASACRIEDERILVEYNIKTESMQHYVLRLCGGMQDFVKMLTSKAIKLKVKSSDTIANMKHKMQEMEAYHLISSALLSRARSLRTNSLRMDSLRTNVP